VCALHRHYKGSGHVCQGRFKAFPIQSDNHDLTVFRAVERNSLRAKMVERNWEWEWSSLKPTARNGPNGLRCDAPILKPAHWTRHVNGAEAELKWLRPIVSGKCSVGLKVVGRHRFIESVGYASLNFHGLVQTSAHAAAEGGLWMDRSLTYLRFSFLHVSARHLRGPVPCDVCVLEVSE